MHPEHPGRRSPSSIGLKLTMPMELGDRAPDGMYPSGEQLQGEDGSEPQGCVLSTSTSILPKGSTDREFGKRSRTAKRCSSLAFHLA